jgi:sugar transferase (PEP-CTERM/EpsH1 system associated)
MNILILTADYPITTRMAGAPRLFNLCRHLAQRHRLHLAFLPKTPARESKFRQDPDNHHVFAELTPLSLAADSSGEPTRWTRWSHRLHGEPYYWLRKSMPGYWRKIRGEISAILERSPVDLLYIDGAEMAQFAPTGCPLPIAIDFCDCLSKLTARHALLERRLRRKISLYLDAWRLGRAEREIAESTDLSIVVSEPDAQGLKARSARARTLVIPLGVDTEYFAAPAAAPATSERGKAAGRLTFTGVMDYGPNADAATYFGREVFPLVRNERPGAEFWIVGANPPGDVAALARLPGVHVTGAVDDVRPYLQHSDIFVCPLRYGTGMKNKILNAWSMKVPVVATPLSLDGLEARAGEHALTADGPAEFAAHIGTLLNSREKREKLVESGRALVESQFAWPAQGARLEAALVALRQIYTK